MSQDLTSGDPIWIPKSVILALHLRQLAEHGGSDGLRDEGLLDSALARPQQLWSYGAPAPDLCALAASLATGLAKNHPFLDGNKRTAHVAYRLFLRRNGLDLDASFEDRYLAMWRLAAGEIDETAFADWLRSHTQPITDT